VTGNNHGAYRHEATRYLVRPPPSRADGTVFRYAATRSTMDAAELIREAEALARPCVYLRASGDAYAAVWTEGRRRELTFDSARLPAPGWPRQGLFTVTTGDPDGHISFSAGASLPQGRAGLKLHASPGASLPPVDGLFLLGSERVAAWLRELGWPRGAAYNDNFPARGIVGDYERHYQEQLPFYSGGPTFC